MEEEQFQIQDNEQFKTKKKESRIDGINYSLRVAFSQQILNTWQPRETLAMDLVWTGIVGVAFLVIGIVLLVFSRNLEFIKVRYDELCTGKRTCSVTFTLGADVTAPIYFYYELSNFNQNLRQLYTSFNSSQLRGSDLSTSSLTSCGSVLTNNDLLTTQSIGNKLLSKPETAYPCGGLPKAYFNDSFKLFKLTDGGASTSYELLLNTTGISYSSDSSRYSNLPGTTARLSRQWLDVTDERFMVWMRISPTNLARKLHSKIERSTMERGTYRVDISNNWDATPFQSEKAVIIAQTNALGGKNLFLANAFIITGSLILLVFIFLGVRRFIRPKSILYDHLRRLRRTTNDKADTK